MDALDIGIGWHESPVPTVGTLVPRAAFAAIAQGVLHAVTVPVIAGNRINRPEVADAERAIREGARVGRAIAASGVRPRRRHGLRPCAVAPLSWQGMSGAPGRPRRRRRRESGDGNMRFQGKVALITGSSRGIGRALALTLAREGAAVVVHYRQNHEAAARTVAEVEASGGTAWPIAADLEDLTAIQALSAAIAARHGRLDIFVANAAATAFRPALELKPHHLERTFNMNVRAFVVGVQHAVPLMPPGSRILAISSYGSARAFPTYANLGASKAALEAWVRYFAEELGGRDINLNLPTAKAGGF